jgi:hypothetical protein
VRSYVKNQGLGFTIPYTIDGQPRSYLPDFIARIDPAADRYRAAGTRTGGGVSLACAAARLGEAPSARSNAA